MGSMKTLHLIIYGRVQGVYFRSSMYQEAHKLGITGWVKNHQSNGSVEAVIQGKDSSVDKMVTWVNRGPVLAYVERVDIEESKGTFIDFVITG